MVASDSHMLHSKGRGHGFRPFDEHDFLALARSPPGLGAEVLIRSGHSADFESASHASGGFPKNPARARRVVVAGYQQKALDVPPLQFRKNGLGFFPR